MPTNTPTGESYPALCLIFEYADKIGMNAKLYQGAFKDRMKEDACMVRLIRHAKMSGCTDAQIDSAMQENPRHAHLRT